MKISTTPLFITSVPFVAMTIVVMLLAGITLIGFWVSELDPVVESHSELVESIRSSMETNAFSISKIPAMEREIEEINRQLTLLRRFVGSPHNAAISTMDPQEFSEFLRTNTFAPPTP